MSSTTPPQSAPYAASSNPLGDLEDLSNLGSGSVQLMFAKLQLRQSSLSKERATEYMNKIKGIQDLQKECAHWISEARKLKQQAGDKDDKPMPPEMKAFFDKYGLAVAGNGKKDGWTENITSLTNFQESIGNETQTHMVYLQDFIGQYNSFLQGANTAIATANQVMTNVARGQ